MQLNVEISLVARKESLLIIVPVGDATYSHVIHLPSSIIYACNLEIHNVAV